MPRGTFTFRDSLRAAGIGASHPVACTSSRFGRFRAQPGAPCCWMFRAPAGLFGRGCEAGYLGAQVALASDAAGTLYALWNAGAYECGRERMYFFQFATGGASLVGESGCVLRDDQTEHCFSRSYGGSGWRCAHCMDGYAQPGDVRISLCGMFSSAARVMAARPGRRRVNSLVQCAAMTTPPGRLPLSVRRVLFYCDR